MNMMYVQRFGQGMRSALTGFNRQSLQSRNALRAGLSCSLAAWFALWLQADQPYWACISALIVTQTYCRATWSKAVLRFIATVMGALVGLLITHLLIQAHFMVYMMIFVLSFIGIYLSNVDRKRSYIWLLGFITALMVIYGGIANPAPSSFLHLAFYRSFEVTLGIIAAFIVSHLFMPHYAKHELQQAIITLTEAMIPLLNDAIALIIAPSESPRAHMQTQIIALGKQIQTLQDLWQLSQQEGLDNPHHKHYQSVKLYYRLIGFFELIVDLHRRHHTASNAYLMQFKSTLLPYLEALKTSYQALYHDLNASHENWLSLRKALTTLNTTWCTLSTTIEQARGQLNSLSYSIDTVDEGIQQLGTLDRLRQELHAIAHPQADNVPERIITKRSLSQLTHYDQYYLKHAFITASVLVCLPLIWILLSLPGFTQIAVSIAAIVGISPEDTRYKGFLRILGCAAGLAAAIALLGLDIDDVSLLLLVVLVVTTLFGYIHFGNKDISYFGTQALVVFFIGVVADLTPALSMTMVMQRMMAILIGVFGMVGFQLLFWRYRASSQQHHDQLQFQRALYPLTQALQQRLWSAQTHCWSYKAPYFFNMRLALINLHERDDALYPIMSQLFHRLYFIAMFTTEQHDDPQWLASTFPELPQLTTMLFDVLTYPQAHTTSAQTLIDALTHIRQQCRDDLLLVNTPIRSACWVIMVLANLRDLALLEQQRQAIMVETY